MHIRKCTELSLESCFEVHIVSICQFVRLIFVYGDHTASICLFFKQQRIIPVWRGSILLLSLRSNEKYCGADSTVTLKI